MTFGDYFAIAFVVLFTIVSLAGFWLVAAAIWPRRVLRCRQFCERGIFVNLLIGLVPFTIAVIVCVRVIQMGGPVQAVGFVLAGGLLFFSHVGVAGFAEHIGSKLSPPDTAQWFRCRRGGGALAATFLIPVIGWVIVFLLVTALGCGVLLRSLFSKGVVATEKIDLEDGTGEKSGSEATR